MSRSHHKTNGTPGTPKDRTIDIAVDHRDAKELRISGSFCSWDPHGPALKRDSHGVWHAKLHLPPGRYEYRLLADSVWCDDPKCRDRVPNPFGGENCVLLVS